MMTTVTEGTLLWQPSEAIKQQSNLSAYMRWLNTHKGLVFNDYPTLWQWSTDHISDFWQTLWDYFNIKTTHPHTQVLSSHTMPGARWFAGAELNYAEHVFRNMNNEHPAVLFQSERHPLTAISWATLHREVSAVSAGLQALGVVSGDRVVAYMPNIPQTLVAFLACAALGAIWSSCSPDFGSPSVIDRFIQIEPKILFAVDGYQYGGKAFDRRSTVVALQQALPSLEYTIMVPYLNPLNSVPTLRQVLSWDDLLNHDAELTFTPMPFEHPLWVLYSSGTTGLPKPIVHSQGGILLEHLKSLHLHFDLKPSERFFWYTTTGWMMWNFQIGALLVGATPLIYDGSPAWPTMHVLWEFAQNSKMSFFGTSAGYIISCLKAGIAPNIDYDLSTLQGMGSTGSPLPPEGFQWVYEHVKHDLWMASYSGGTDICSGFVGACRLLPVHAGEIQCSCLGVKAQAFDEQGNSVVGVMGELVITEPMPSMPIYFWNDPDNTRYIASYFEHYPGIWRHGDWVVFKPIGSLVIYGRSDSTINRMGVRMGTSEIYSVVDSLPEIIDSLVIDLEGLGGSAYMPLFVMLRDDIALDDGLKTRIKQAIRSALSPRHVPDEIFAVPEIPRTLSGKKLEVPVKKILQGIPLEQAANPDSMKNPNIMTYFVTLAEQMPK